MRVSLITLRFDSALSCFDDRALDSLLAGRELLELREHFFLSGGVPHLVCVVHYRDGVAGARSQSATLSPQRPQPVRPRAAGAPEEPKARPKKPRDNPLDALDDRQLRIFETLRAWRSDVARDEGVPPYVVLINRELAAVVQLDPKSNTALSQVPGIGQGKLERYGSALLARLQDCLNRQTPAPATPPESEAGPEPSETAAAAEVQG